MPLEDKATRRRVEHEMSKFPLDFANASVAVINSVAYFTGRVKSMRRVTGTGTSTKELMNKVAEAVLLLPGIKECVLQGLYYD